MRRTARKVRLVCGEQMRLLPAASRCCSQASVSRRSRSKRHCFWRAKRLSAHCIIYEALRRSGMDEPKTTRTVSLRPGSTTAMQLAGRPSAARVSPPPLAATAAKAAPPCSAVLARSWYHPSPSQPCGGVGSATRKGSTAGCVASASGGAAAALPSFGVAAGRHTRGARCQRQSRSAQAASMATTTPPRQWHACSARAIGPSRISLCARLSPPLRKPDACAALASASSSSDRTASTLSLAASSASTRCTVSRAATPVALAGK
mmetsp:Transcript_39212/g.78378  ORF Transcript_39212/g.78378 Transcript_39212/m.78378 type:complete len:262 (-) Transcript_39212:159-944(-)